VYSDPATQTAINDICPWSGKPVSEQALAQYKGRIVGFCNVGCRDKFAAAIDHFDQAIASCAPAMTQQMEGMS